MKSVILFLFLYSTTSFGEKPKHKREVPIPSGISSSSTTQSSSAGKNPPQKTRPRVSEHSSSSLSQTSSSTRSECTQNHPIETFVQISSANAPQSGKSGGVYFLSDLRETQQLFYLESPGTWPEQMTFFPDGVAYYRISPNGGKILVATQVGGDEQYQIHLLDTATKKLTPLLVDRASRVESVVWSPSSKWFAFTSTQRNKRDIDLYRFDLASGKSTLLLELEGHNSVTDISPDEKLISFTHYVSVTESDVLIFDQDKKQMTNLTLQEPPSSAMDGHFSRDSKGIFFLSDETKGIHQLFFLSLRNPSRRKPLTASSWPLEDLVFNDDRSALLYLANRDGYTEISGFELELNGAKKRGLVVPEIRTSIIRSAHFSKKHGKNSFFFSVTSSQNSPDIWLWQSPTQTQWTRSTHGLMDPNCFIREELVHYPSFDGMEIPAFLFLPKGTHGESPVPFIVYVHGGPESQYRPGFSKIFQYYLERGYGVFAPNIRGSTGYGKEYTLLDNYKKRMDSVKDVLEGAKWLLKNRYATPGQLAIYGGSYGGFLVLRSIEVEPELFSAASESVGIANFVTFLENTKPYRRALREVEYGPLSDKDFLRSISPTTYVEKIKTPLLIFHGANDPRVPVKETEQIVEELKKREIPVEYKIFADEGHGNGKLRNIMEQAKLMVYFFEKHLKKKGP